uniref:Ac18 n=1 Tax=Spodoptera frugiperda nuclear polyhedrosis virus TaxID=10455 RepID=B2KWX4_NPVSF|nr:unknown [Spodoptera frugiperda multiple nucleopolyhedrovirus]QED40099.1 hypothetical protein [Spodoptera frugiperda multiple nucleopolyhedrovirus]
MEHLQNRLLKHRAIPYISKKFLNDRLTDLVLRNADKTFHRRILPATVRALDTLSVIKGGAAIAVHLNNNTPTHLSDLDLEVYVDDENVTIENLSSYVSLERVEQELKTICENYYDNIDQALATININRLMNNTYARDKMFIFKSYINEAIEFVPDHVRFCLNHAQPFKSTVSIVNDDYFLVRYSFNVHMKSFTPIRLHKENNHITNLQFFPLDVFFLDVSVKRSPASFVNMYSLGNIFGVDVYIENIKYLIADQLECILFNIFNFYWNKVESRIDRVGNLLNAQTDYFIPTNHEIERYEKIVKQTHQRFTARDVKPLLYALGPLGPQAIIELYFLNRFDNNIKYITHQVNFPYHVWEQDYYSKCWKQFLYILNNLYNLKYNVEI